MSGVDRWYFDVETDDYEMDDDGDYVLYSDHAAEIARLRAEADALRVDAMRWRHARKLLRADEIQAGADSLARSGGLFNEAVNVAADNAIDAAMGADA